MHVPQSADNVIFALDIGTRTVIGLVGCMEGKNFKIIAQEFIEHEGRSMYDGQIHDIPRVAEVVAAVKSRLENKTGLALDKVAVAAAGRTLKTVRCRVEMEHDINREIELLDIRGLELAALRKAHRELERGREDDCSPDYFCVGHCVITYLLDDLPVSNLLGHMGDRIGAEIVATFLPATVVNSLYTVLHRVNLEPIHLTLEPIAAIDVAIPENYRLLNLALVDIGAGTSDIAITRDGSIVAYGMVPQAGDEITEPIVENLLVEFNEAEKIKRLLGSEEEITYTDIIGVTGTVSREKLIQIIDPVLNKLADAIVASILELNGGTPPKSVFCIGGGARVPTLTEKLAERLQLDKGRVVIRDRSFVQNLVCENDDLLAGPEGVTVVGIATVALTRLGYEFMQVKINGRGYKLFNSRNITVSQALGLIKYDPRHLMARNGQDLKFFLNDRPHTVFGGLRQPARILLNGQEANLQSTVQDGDEILVIKAVPGPDACARVADFLPEERKLIIHLNGRDVEWTARPLLNGKEADPAAELQNGDRLVIIQTPTVEEIAGLCGINPAGRQVMINGHRATAQDTLSNGDIVEILAIGPREKDYRPHPTNSEGNIPGITLTVNGEEIALPVRKAIFVDIFNYIDIDTSKPRGMLVMTINGKRAQYTDPVRDGDRIEIYWDQNKEKTGRLS